MKLRSSIFFIWMLKNMRLRRSQNVPHFGEKCSKSRRLLRLCLRPRWEAYHAPSDPLVVGSFLPPAIAASRLRRLHFLQFYQYLSLHTPLWSALPCSDPPRDHSIPRAQALQSCRPKRGNRQGTNNQLDLVSHDNREIHLIPLEISLKSS